MIEMMDTVENDLDKSMKEGFEKESLSPIMFERFLGRRVECKTQNGTYIGDAFQYDMEGGKAYLNVDQESTSDIKIFYDDVISIKDITE